MPPTVVAEGEAGGSRTVTPGRSHCEECGAELSPEDIFCGECGHVVRDVSDELGPRATERSRDAGREGDTAVIEPLPFSSLPDRTPVPRRPPASAPRPVPPLPVAPSPADGAAEIEDLEATRIVGRGQRGQRFVLQFSTGESSTVHGTGLVGRNPRPEPGEYFDQLVRVLDPSRSVSKTHLEFGQDSGSFWIKDRFSGNGTVVREPDGQPVRCPPDKRVHVVRGTRVDIGEQFFIVS